MDDIAKLDPDWHLIHGWAGDSSPGIWEGNGQQCVFIIREESDAFVVRLDFGNNVVRFVNWPFGSLRSAKQWCERYFG